MEKEWYTYILEVCGSSQSQFQLMKHAAMALGCSCWSRDTCCLTVNCPVTNRAARSHVSSGKLDGRQKMCCGKLNLEMQGKVGKFKVYILQ